MANWPPSVSDFQAYFSREFKYSDGKDAVTAADIRRSLSEAAAFFNQSLFPASNTATIAYLYLAAHIMILNIQSAGGLSALPLGRGVRNVGEGVQVAKGVGQASVTYQVPAPRIANNPTFLYFFRTDFGQRYMAMVEPLIVGAAAVVCGPNAQQFTNE